MIKPRCRAFQQDDCENEFIYDDSVRDKVQKNERSVDEVKVLSVNEASRGMQLSGEEVWDTTLGCGYGLPVQSAAGRWGCGRGNQDCKCNPMEGRCVTAVYTGRLG